MAKQLHVPLVCAQHKDASTPNAKHTHTHTRELQRRRTRAVWFLTKPLCSTTRRPPTAGTPFDALGAPARHPLKALLQGQLPLRVGRRARHHDAEEESWRQPFCDPIESFVRRQHRQQPAVRREVATPPLREPLVPRHPVALEELLPHARHRPLAWQPTSEHLDQARSSRDGCRRLLASNFEPVATAAKVCSHRPPTTITLSAQTDGASVL